MKLIVYRSDMHLYGNYTDDSSRAVKKRKFGDVEYVSTNSNPMTGKGAPKGPLLFNRVITRNSPTAFRGESISFHWNDGSTSEPRADADSGIIQVPGTEICPIMRQTGAPTHVDRLSEYFFAEYIRLQFTVEYRGLVRLRVLAMKVQRRSTKFVYSATGAATSMELVNLVRGPNGVIGPHLGDLSHREGPFTVIEDVAGAAVIDMPAQQLIEGTRQGNVAIYDQYWEDQGIFPTTDDGTPKVGYVRRKPFNFCCSIKEAFRMRQPAERIAVDGFHINWLVIVDCRPAAGTGLQVNNIVHIPGGMLMTLARREW